MIDVNTFTSEVKNQILGWLSAIGNNLVCPLITAAAIIYCIFQLPQLFKVTMACRMFSGSLCGRRLSVWW